MIRASVKIPVQCPSCLALNALRTAGPPEPDDNSYTAQLAVLCKPRLQQIDLTRIALASKGSVRTMALPSHSSSPSQPFLVEDIPRILKLYSDGSVLRIPDNPSLNLPPSEQPLDENGGVASRDIVLDQNLGLWLRIYLPPQPRRSNLPVVIYFHGGGFVYYSPAVIVAHHLCNKWSAAVGAIMVSVNYRLAPEHRLPAAYEDSIAAVEWVRSQAVKKRAGEADPWFDSHADFSNAYLMGDSAGGNIAHHVGMWAGGQQWEDMRIRGMVLLQPFFGGQDRTASEIRCPDEAVITLEATDKVWGLALPVGETRDHPFSNPFGRQSESPGLVDASLPPLLVAIGGRDLLSDRQLKYCEELKKCGKKVQVVAFEEEEHGFYALKLEEESSLKLIGYACEFINCRA